MLQNNTRPDENIKETLTTKQYSPLKNPQVNISVDLINEDSILVKKFNERLKVALSKFTSSRKTRVVHELMTKNMISIALIHGYKDPVNIFYKENTLYKIYINVADADSLNTNNLSALLNKVKILRLKHKELSRLVSSHQIVKLESLQEELDEVREKILSTIDWLKIVDLAYFGILQFYAVQSVNKNKPERIKVFMTTEDLLLKQLRKILGTLDKSLLPSIKSDDTNEKTLNEESESIQKLRLGVQFFMLTYFLQMKSKPALKILTEKKSAFVRINLDILFPDEDNKLKTPYEVNLKHEKLEDQQEKITEEYEKIVKDFSMVKIELFEDISKILGILDIANVVNLTPSSFKTLMLRYTGEEVYNNYYTFLPKFMALMANLTYKTQLFPKLFEVDSVLQNRLEELLLNQKSYCIIKESKIL